VKLTKSWSINLNPGGRNWKRLRDLKITQACKPPNSILHCNLIEPFVRCSQLHQWFTIQKPCYVSATTQVTNRDRYKHLILIQIKLIPEGIKDDWSNSIS
jgi:hypothetical protein